MNFMDAVKSMQEGKKVKRTSWGDSKYYWNRDMLVNEVTILSWNNITAIDWEIVEEPKKTLSDKGFDKFWSKIEDDLDPKGNLLYKKDVREHLKEFLEPYDKDGITWERAKEIFGEILL